MQLPDKKSVLVLGASSNPERYSCKACLLLSEHGYSVYALGAKKEVTEKFTIHDTWPEADSIDTVSIYLNTERQKSCYGDILSLHPRRVIFNPGSENPELISLLGKAGIACEKACTLVLLHTGQF